MGSEPHTEEHESDVCIDCMDEQLKYEAGLKKDLIAACTFADELILGDDHKPADLDFLKEGEVDELLGFLEEQLSELDQRGMDGLEHEVIQDGYFPADYYIQPWELVDAEEQAENHPDTFHIESRKIRCTLPETAWAKVAFEDKFEAHPGERMWLRIEERLLMPDGAVHYHGTLQSNPMFFDLEFGERICFDPCNIFDWLPEGYERPNDH